MSRHDSREIENVKVMLLKGENGSSMVNIEKTGTQGLVDTYTITMDDGSKFTFNVSNGKEITSVVKTGTSGLVDTYTITFNDDSTESFTVTNGNGIASIQKTGTNVLVDTYTITMDDGSTSTFTVTNGNGIESIEKTATVGAVDTYTITLTDGSTTTFTVTNATGTIDSDFSETSENPVENRVITNKIKAMDDNIAGTEDGATASQTYVAGEFILRNNQLYKVTTAIATGDALTVGVNISTDSVGEELQQINSDLNNVISTKAPTSHSSTATTYGIGNASNYGHVKLSDSYTSSAGSASGGVGASSKAVADSVTYNKIYVNEMTVTPNSSGLITISKSKFTGKYVIGLENISENTIIIARKWGGNNNDLYAFSWLVSSSMQVNTNSFNVRVYSTNNIS